MIREKHTQTLIAHSKGISVCFKTLKRYHQAKTFKKKDIDTIYTNIYPIVYK